MAIKVYYKQNLTYESNEKLRSAGCFGALDNFFVDTKHPTKVVNVFGIGDLYIKENSEIRDIEQIQIDANTRYNAYKGFLGRIIDNTGHVYDYHHKTLLENNGSLIIRAIDSQSQELLLTDPTMEVYSWVWKKDLDLNSIVKSNYNILKLW